MFSCLAGVFLVCSCSVKADRLECPCRLNVLVEGGQEADVALSLIGKGGVAYTFDVSSTATVDVRRSSYSASACSGVHNCIQDSSAVLSIPRGCQMDELYAGNSVFDAFEEQQTVIVLMHKQFAYVHITLLDANTEYAYSVLVRGTVAGVNLKDCSPLPGEYEVLLPAVIGNYHRLCVPRQSSASLTLELFDGAQTSKGQSQQSPLQHYAIGQMIQDSGYDWSAVDLSDIYITVDTVSAEVYVQIVDWKRIEVEQ